MDEQIIRNCVVTDRLARGLAEYYSRRVRGVQCPDLLPPDERASIDSRHDALLQNARIFIQTSKPQQLAG
jgi:hypothetical protein